MKGITGLAHVAIKVADLDKSLAFYADKLDFPEMMRLHHPDGRTWLVYLRITDDQYLEIFPEAENDRAPGWNANGVNHFCLQVDDIEAVIAALTKRGVPLMLPLKTGADNNRQAWVEDPDGNRIELMEMGKDSLQLQAIKRMRRAAKGARIAV